MTDYAFYGRADVYQQYDEEKEELEREYYRGCISVEEYNRMRENLDRWLAEELDEIGGY